MSTAMRVLVALAGAVVAAGAYAQGGPASDLAVKQLASTCTQCHGTNGRNTNDFYILAGKSEAFLLEELTRFKEGKREATVMHQISKGYSDEQLKALAAYFSKQK